MTASVLIIDDEPLARQRLQRLIDELPEFSVVAQADSGRALWPLLAEHQPDICLLDIHLPGLSGLELAAQLNTLPSPPAIIFCTAYEQHALAAFDYQAVDYILKPVRPERLATALARARALRVESERKQDQQLVIQQGDKLLQIDWNDVRCLLAEDKYVAVITSTQRYLSNTPLTQFEQSQPERMVRVHRNALVARASIQALVQGESGVSVELSDVEETIVVSRRHLAPLRRQLKDNQGRLP